MPFAATLNRAVTLTPPAPRGHTAPRGDTGRVAGRVAGYDVLTQLGEGAASRLYLVQDRTGRRFAMKWVPKRSADDQRFVEQAVTEHRVAANFDSPRLRRSLKVIPVGPVWKRSGVAVLLEYIDGRPLDAALPADHAERCRAFRGLAEALRTMHAANYVHADLKPANVLIARGTGSVGGRVKLIDFGQSCPLGTRKERVQGTPDYIAPEQLRRGPVDQRTDVYGFGAVLYDLLTGEKASRAMARRKLERTAGMRVEAGGAARPAPVRSLAPDTVPALAALVDACLASNPKRRPSDMAAVVERLTYATHQCRRAVA